MKIRIKFKKTGALRFIGHLDVMRYFQKVMRRAEIPIAFTGGYSPHMIMSFASPLGIGLTSEGEYVDIELSEPISSVEAVARMNEVCVPGIEILSFREISEEKKMTAMAIVAGADYRVTVKNGHFPEGTKERLAQFYAQNEICVLKQTKRSEKIVDIKPLIYQLSMKEDAIWMQLAAGSVENLKPDLVMQAFCEYVGSPVASSVFHYHRVEMYADAGTDGLRKLVTLESLGQEIVLKIPGKEMIAKSSGKEVL